MPLVPQLIDPKYIPIGMLRATGLVSWSTSEPRESLILIGALIQGAQAESFRFRSVPLFDPRS